MLGFTVHSLPIVPTRRRASESSAYAEPITTAAVPTAGRDVRIKDLEDLDVYNFRNEKLGEVKRVVRAIANNQQFVILEHGGFLGLGEKEVPLPLDRFTVRGDRLYFRGLQKPSSGRRPIGT